MSQEYSIVPSSGGVGPGWEDSFVIPEGRNHSISVRDTSDVEGFKQQTFLGASIRSFSCNAGFGDTTSSLTTELVNDEYFANDRTGLGRGNDPYHGGIKDTFLPPVAGAPVFFKFGAEGATTEEAWRQTFDDTYGYTTNTSDNHQFVFGGILQSFTQNRGPGGNPLYSVSVQDPREILSNATIILKNYAGTTYNNKNLFNVFGFLEYDPSDALLADLEGGSTDKSVLRKRVDTNGNIRYVGETNAGNISNYGIDVYNFTHSGFNISNYPPTFPITGRGFARQSDKGMPLYRINQALNTLLEYEGSLPDEYKANGFGGVIDFRGYKYVIDFTGIPFENIPDMYFLDFDQLDILSYVQELADIISHDLIVTLLPVIDHPACSWLFDKNDYTINNGNYSDVIAGIIRIDMIDKSVQPEYGAIKTYLDNLSARGIDVENQDVGYELSNVTTDKFVVGGQEVEMYYFNNNKDRDNLEMRKLENGQTNDYELLQKDQWSLDTMLQQQILPFYGFLGKEAVTIPRGFGAYQQIMLDASSLDANGVGNYYIATEMELRAASVSYDKWRNFLLLYDETYIQELGENQEFLSSLASSVTDPIAGLSDEDKDVLAAKDLAGRDFGVSVPRCVFNSDKDRMGDDGYPASPCSPPYGYPLYYKRAEKIGIPEAGLAAVASSYTSIITNTERIEETAKDANHFIKINKKSIAAQLETKRDGTSKNSAAIQAAYDQIATIEAFIKNSPAQVAALKNFTNRPDQKALRKMLPGIAREYLKNARKVYDFVKDVADTYLGKQFLVKIPTACNVNYSENITLEGGNTNVMEIASGPFGFKPLPISSDVAYADSAEFNVTLSAIREQKSNDPYASYLSINNTSSSLSSYKHGAAKGNFNPISERWEFNYTPDNQGGFFNYALYNRNLSLIESISLTDSQLPPGPRQSLTPRDLTNFVADNGRISCYVRYNHSQYLDFKGVSKDSITQQVLTDEGFVPDVMEQLNNLNPDKSVVLDQISERLKSSFFGNTTEESTAFVKCSVEPRFYMPPRIVSKSTTVWARNYEFVPNFASLDIVEVKDKDGCITYVPAQEYALPIFKVPHNAFGGYDAGGPDGTTVNNQDFLRREDADLKANLVETQTENLDERFVYAIIKVPGRVTPSVDSRYLDGPYKAFNAPKFYNLLTADVVKNVAGFDSPVPITNADKSLDLDKLTTKDFGDAATAQRNTLQGLALDLPEGSLSFTAPSPVYPDIVALPLRSNERCYGPWLSSFVPNYSGDTRVRYSNIGGKVEFVKDESLAPWNYAGYQLMDEAGALKAQFSNSLLLFSERGGFVMPEIPTGISLAKALLDGGPLVTSISVNIDQKISTTVKMDLYTSRFGKLQKQKEEAISKIVRERQKTIDISNDLARKGIVLNAQSNLSVDKYSEVINTARASSQYRSSLERGETVYNNLVLSAKRNTNTLKNLNPGGKSVSISSVEYGSSLQSPGYMEEAMSESLDPDVAYQGLAGGSLPFEGYNETPGDTAYFPAMNYNHTKATQERIFGIGFDEYTPET